MQVCCFIDGFNLYHSLLKLGDEKYKWINLRLLSEQFIEPGDTLSGVFYFSAYCEWDEGKKNRHKLYVRALAEHNVQIILGSFKRVSKTFIKKKMEVLYSSTPRKLQKFLIPDVLKYRTHEEKETDINMAIRILDCANKNLFDKAIIISGDSDLVPVINAVKHNDATKKFTCVLPVSGKGRRMMGACDQGFQMTKAHLANCIMPAQITTGDGSIIQSPYVV